MEAGEGLKENRRDCGDVGAPEDETRMASCWVSAVAVKAGRFPFRPAMAKRIWRLP